LILISFTFKMFLLISGDKKMERIATIDTCMNFDIIPPGKYIEVMFF